MLKIAICDNENAICSQIEAITLDYCKNDLVKIEVDVFYSGEDLYKAMLQGENFDLIFLDIELNIVNGVEVGRKIRDELKNENTQIIYISAKDSYAMELFQVRPMNFLIKPLSREKIEKAFSKTLELTKARDCYFEFDFGKSTHKILISDISYFESEGKK